MSNTYHKLKLAPPTTIKDETDLEVEIARVEWKGKCEGCKDEHGEVLQVRLESTSSTTDYMVAPCSYQFKRILTKPA